MLKIDRAEGKKGKKAKTRESKKRLIHGLKSKDVIDLLESLEGVKLDYDDLYYYEHTGLLVPSIRSAQGRGFPKLYSVEDFIIIRWLVILQNKGVSLRRFRGVVDFLKKKMPNVLNEPQNWVLFTDGEKVQFFDKVSSQTIEVLEDTGQYLFAFPLEKIVRHSREEIDKLLKNKK